MGQEPNIQLEMGDLPRPVAAPAAARRWSPRRPGELGSPEEVPWGGMFGTPGPDTGYVLKLLREEELELAPGESRADAVMALASLAGARASAVGRAPTGEDVRVAMTLLGFDDSMASHIREGLAERRPHWVANVAHDSKKLYELVGAVDVAVLRTSPQEVAAMMAGGDNLIAL